ncbi:MAG: transposase [Synergistaceae bacterium]|jgi:IS5 family transposase|nr:transposase [Synergistaceae bacterium]
MNKQKTFTDFEYANRKKTTRREDFLKKMDEVIPRGEWVAVIQSYCPEGKRGRPPLGIETTLRMYLSRSWFNMSDEMAEDSIYDSYATRGFMGIDFDERQAQRIF